MAAEWVYAIEYLGPELSEGLRRLLNEKGIENIRVPKKMPKDAIISLERSRISHGRYEELKKEYGLSRATLYRYKKKLKEDGQ